MGLLCLIVVMAVRHGWDGLMRVAELLLSARHG